MVVGQGVAIFGWARWWGSRGDLARGEARKEKPPGDLARGEAKKEKPSGDLARGRANQHWLRALGELLDEL